MDLGNFMEGLGMSPFSYVNVGGMCAVTRLLQLRTLGINSIPVEGKIRKEAENVATGRPVKNSSILSPPTEWLLWGQAVDAMGRQCAKSQTTFKVVLFEWVVAEGEEMNYIQPPCLCCGIAKEVGNLVFVDRTTKQYIVVQCDSGKRKPRELKMHARRMANVLFCITRYIGYGPEFVRYCVYTKGDKDLPEGVTDPKCTPPSKNDPWGEDAWGEVNQSNFKPALKPRDLGFIDKILTKDDFMVWRVEKDRKEQGLDVQRLRDEVEARGFLRSLGALHPFWQLSVLAFLLGVVALLVRRLT